MSGTSQFPRLPQPKDVKEDNEQVTNTRRSCKKSTLTRPFYLMALDGVILGDVLTGEKVRVTEMRLAGMLRVMLNVYTFH